jgi:hypothetical protein
MYNTMKFLSLLKESVEGSSKVIDKALLKK